MWLLYFLITTGLAMLAGTPERWAFTGRRSIVVVAGIFCTFVLYRLLQRVQPRSFGARLAAAMGTAIPLVILYATVNLLVFFYWFPSDDTQRIIAEMGTRFPVSWELMLILDSSIRWYFFFAVWAALYVARLCERDARGRAARQRLSARGAECAASRTPLSGQSALPVQHAEFALDPRHARVEGRCRSDDHEPVGLPALDPGDRPRAVRQPGGGDRAPAPVSRYRAGTLSRSAAGRCRHSPRPRKRLRARPDPAADHRECAQIRRRAEQREDRHPP